MTTDGKGRKEEKQDAPAEDDELLMTTRRGKTERKQRGRGGNETTEQTRVEERQPAPQLIRPN